MESRYQCGHFHPQLTVFFIFFSKCLLNFIRLIYAPWIRKTPARFIYARPASIIYLLTGKWIQRNEHARYNQVTNLLGYQLWEMYVRSCYIERSNNWCNDKETSQLLNLIRLLSLSNPSLPILIIIISWEFLIPVNMQDVQNCIFYIILWRNRTR